MGFAGCIQFLKSPFGIQIFREYTEGFLAFPQSVVRHFNFEHQPIGDVTHYGGIPWSTPSLSPALIGIGYIIGPTLSAINFSGGVLAWWILIPLLLFFDPDLPRRIGSNDPCAWRPTRCGSTSCGPSRWARCWWARRTRCSPCGRRWRHRCAARLRHRRARRTKGRTANARTATSRAMGAHGHRRADRAHHVHLLLLHAGLDSGDHRGAGDDA